MFRTKATPGVAFFFCAACVFALSLSAAVEARTWTVGVDAVVDGDTLILAGGERLRLRGIDAPELAHQGRPGQYFAGESKKILSAVVQGRSLQLETSELERDRYGRLVGLARLSDGRLVNLLMIELGAAFVYPHASDKDNGLGERMLAAQRAAMDGSKGFWPVVLHSRASVSKFTGTRSSRRFHVQSCSLGREVKESNKVRFSSLRDAFAAGYAPARECTPWPPQRGR